MNTKRNRICVLIPYYGKWPSFFGLYLKSCAYNPSLEIVFITDLELPDGCPAHVSKIHKSFSEVADFFSEKLNVPVALDSYYKLCDLKPTYGYVFEEYIKDFDFWGFGDIDLIYGHVEKFIPDEILQQFDVLTYRTEWLSGALTLFRNTRQVNELFFKSADWEKVATTPKHYSFTECARQYKAVVAAGSIFDVPLEIETMSLVVKRAALNNQIRLFENKWIKESIGSNDFVEFAEGKVRDSAGKEYLHYHYITEKGRESFTFPEWQNIPGIFYVTRTGFFRNLNSPWSGIINVYRKIRGRKRAFFKPRKKNKH